MNFNFLTLETATTTTADGTAIGGLGGWYPIVMLAIMFLAMYFFLIRPQKKREKVKLQDNNKTPNDKSKKEKRNMH